jgi:hypothetical protein
MLESPDEPDEYSEMCEEMAGVTKSYGAHIAL